MDVWATPFFNLKHQLFCPSLVNRVKDLVYSNSIMKLIKWLAGKHSFQFHTQALMPDCIIGRGEVNKH